MNKIDLLKNRIINLLIFTLLVVGFSKALNQILKIDIPFFVALLITVAMYYILRFAYTSLKYFTIFLCSIFILFLTSIFVFGKEIYTNILLNIRLAYILNTLLDKETQVLIGFLIFLLSASLFYFLAIRKEKFLLILIIGFIVFNIIWFLGYKEKILLDMYMYICGSLMVASASVYKKNKIKIPYSKWQLYSLITVILVFSIPIIMVSNSTKVIYWKDFNKAINSVSNIQIKSGFFTKARTFYRISSAGFSNDESSTIGGSVNPSDKMIASVKSNYPTLLKGTVLNNFSGNTWNMNFNNRRYNLGYSIFQKSIDNSFDKNEFFWSTEDEYIRNKYVTTYDIAVKVEDLNCSCIFNASFTNSILHDEEFDFKIYTNDRSESFANRNLMQDEEYIINVSSPNMEDEDFLDYVIEKSLKIDFRNQIPQSYIDDPILFNKYEKIRNNYMNIPNVSQMTINLTNQLTKEYNTSIEKILAIEKYLLNHGTYTLSPANVAPDDDFIHNFLFIEKKGYCSYYATTMAIMGRIAGVPTRYVEGLYSRADEDNEEYVILKGENAHAWVEAYFPNIGWLSFDPTPPIYLENMNTTTNEIAFEGEFDFDEDYGYDEEFIDDMENEDLSLDNNQLDLTDKNEDSILLLKYIKLVIILSGIVLAIAIMYLLLNLLYRKKYNYYDKLANNEIVLKYYREILWLFALDGTPMIKGETPTEYANRIDIIYDIRSMKMKSILNNVYKTKYENFIISDIILYSITSYHMHLEKLVTKKYGKIRYLIISLIYGNTKFPYIKVARLKTHKK